MEVSEKYMHLKEATWRWKYWGGQRERNGTGGEGSGGEDIDMDMEDWGCSDQYSLVYDFLCNNSTTRIPKQYQSILIS